MTKIQFELDGKQVEANTGETIDLSLYANRQGVNVNFKWFVTSQPPGASDTVKNWTGTASCGDGYECAPITDKRPVLIPRNPGEYTLTVTADLAETDTIEPSVKHAETTLAVTVDGTAIDRGGGCGISGRRPAGLLVVLGLGLAMLWRRRR